MPYTKKRKCGARKGQRWSQDGIRMHDGYYLRQHESGDWSFVEGVKPKERYDILTQEETQKLNACARRRKISTVSDTGRYTMVEGVKFY